MICPLEVGGRKLGVELPKAIPGRGNGADDETTRRATEGDVIVAARASACDWAANPGTIDEVSNIAANIPLASKIGAPAQLSPMSTSSDAKH